MGYWLYVLCTLGAWLLGVFADANIGFEPMGFLCLRVLFPVLAAGICILKALKDDRKQ